MAMKKSSIAFVCSALLAIGGCDRSKDREPYGSMPSGTPSAPVATNPPPREMPPAGTSTPSEAPRATLTDAQTLAILDAANVAEIDQSNEALRRTTNARVKVLAQQMIQAHARAQKDLAELARTSAMTKEPSWTSRQLESDAKDEIALLRATTSAAEVDRRYVDAMVTQHQDLLDTIEKKMLPSVENPALEKILAKLRDEVRDQLQMAQGTRSSLPKA